MLVNIFHDSPREHRRLMLAGVCYFLVIALLVALSIAIYDKKFTRSTTVTVMADRAGQQLSRFGDVRMHGALVGHVENVTSQGNQAAIRLSLDPEAARAVPADVDVRILPTTLFGQKFIELVPPSDSVSAARLKDGAVIPADRVTTNVELQSVLADLFPLLRSIKPADLNATLNALAGALSGKGDQIGATLVTLDDYLGRFNEQLPTVQSDLRLLADVADTYDLAAPDLLKIMRSASVTARTVTDKKADLGKALAGLTGLAVTTRETLAENEDLLVETTQAGRPLLALLDRYSPEYNCLLTGLVRQIPDTKAVFKDGIIRQTLELGAPQRAVYTAEDAPVYGEVGHGPWCLGLPDDYDKPAPFIPLKDGSDKDNPDGGLG